MTMLISEDKRDQEDMIEIAKNWLTNMVLDKCHWFLVRDGDKIVGVAIDAGDAAATPMGASTTLRGLEGWGFEGIYESTQDISKFELPRLFKLDPRFCEYRSTGNANPITECSFKGGYAQQPTYFVFRGDKNIELVLNLLNPEKEVSGERELLNAVRGR